MIPLPLPWRQTEAAADYSAVVVPLEEAHQHSHTYRQRLRGDADGRLDEGAFRDDGGLDKDPAEGDTTTMLMTSTAPPEYSIEGLRREVRGGEKGERWTAYESELPRHLSGRKADLTGYDSEVSTHQQGDPGYWHGPVQLAAVCAVRVWLVC